MVRTRMIFLRSLVWSLIGLIYAPLFAGLREAFLDLGLRSWAFIPAAAVAGAVGATFYGSRQVAIVAALVGILTGMAYTLATTKVHVIYVLLTAAALGLLLGSFFRFPERCSRWVPGKFLVGMITGAFCGFLLAVAEPLHERTFNTVGVVAFLVGANGVLYVAFVARPSLLVDGRRCRNLVGAVILAVLASVVAGSIWIVAGPIAGIVDQDYYALIGRIHEQIPAAIAGGLIGGAVAGALLEVAGFKWVHDI